MGHAVGWGNGYAQIVLNGAGRVTELWPLRPDKMTVKRVDGQLQYIYRRSEPDENGRMERTFAAREIFHVPGLGFDGISGYSPISMARQAIGLGLAAEEFGARFFGNDARPGIVLKHPLALSETAYDRLKKSQEDEHSGVRNSHKPMILEEGMDIKEIGIPPEDAQFLQTRLFQLREMARLYRVPPHMLADLERATFNNIEEMGQEFVDYSLLPWATRWEQ
jgi:HK97 family phage portal protein